mmetsp:Transcript_36715/g.109651  ORF Transcript_36715/g.109651 Transcript_36715/m.109651 type:complete len:94 (+) Transcript_36715:286-567(+)
MSARRPASAGSTPQPPLAPPPMQALALPLPPPLPAAPVLPSPPCGGKLAGSIQLGASVPKVAAVGPTASDVFSLIDANHDGVLTRAELKQAFA